MLLQNGSYLHQIAGHMGCYNRLSTEEFLGSLLLNPKSFESEIASMRFDDCQKVFYRGPLFHTFVHLRRLYHKLHSAEMLLDEYELSQAEAHYTNGEKCLKNLSRLEYVSSIACDVRISADLGFWPSCILYAWCLDTAVDCSDACEIRHYINLADVERQNSDQYQYAQYLYNHLLAWHDKKRSRYPTLNRVERERERERCLLISRCSSVEKTKPSAPKTESWLESIMKVLEVSESMTSDEVARREYMVKGLLAHFRVEDVKFDSDRDKLSWIAQHCTEKVREGSAVGYFAYGLCWYLGIGVAENKVRAARYFKMSADSGAAAGQYMCGIVRLLGDGVAQDLEEGAKYIKMSAKKGFPMGQFRYGVCLRKGEGVAQNMIKAARYFKLSAVQGNALGLFNFGSCLQYGLGVPRNIYEATRCYQLSADMGLAQAQYNYGMALFSWRRCFSEHHRSTSVPQDVCRSKMSRRTICIWNVPLQR